MLLVQNSTVRFIAGSLDSYQVGFEAGAAPGVGWAGNLCTGDGLEAAIGFECLIREVAAFRASCSATTPRPFQGAQGAMWIDASALRGVRSRIRLLLYHALSLLPLGGLIPSASDGTESCPVRLRARPASDAGQSR